MRNATFMILLAGLALSACDRTDPAGTANGTNGAATPSTRAMISAGVVTGNLTPPGGAAAQLPAGAVVTVRLLDGTRSDAPPAEILARQIQSTGSLPMLYTLTFDPKTIERGATYLVDANVTLDGQLLYLTQARLPVLTQGASNAIDIPLVQGLAMVAPVSPAEDTRRRYAELEAQLGAMKRLVGNRIVGDTTIGWDAFADDTGVRMVRENVDYGEAGGKAGFNYAFRDGKPWVAVKQQGGASTMVAWDEFGNIVVREVTRGDDTSEASEAVAAELEGGAEEILKIASAKL